MSCLRTCSLVVVLVSILVGFLATRQRPAYVYTPHPNSGKWGGDSPATDDGTPQPYTIHTSDAQLETLKVQLEAALLVPPVQGLQSETHLVDGVDHELLRNVLKVWQTFDWRAAEAKLNTLPHYTLALSGLRIHFVDAPAAAEATEVRTLLLLHGWPGSVVEFTKILPMLTSPDENGLAFRVIAPSMPGYGWSDVARVHGMSAVEIAAIYLDLMAALLPEGERFYIQAGDWGGMVGRSIAQLGGVARVAGFHANFLPAFPPVALGIASYFFPSYFLGQDKAMVTPLVDFALTTVDLSGYLHEHATRPETIGAALSASPGALAAWLVEKYMAWADDGRYPFTLEELCLHMMVYWTTGTITSSIRLYKESLTSSAYNSAAQAAILVPTGYADFPLEPMRAPEAWVRASAPDLIHYGRQPRGGHFAAWEEPGLVNADFRTFVGKVEARDGAP